MSNINDLLSTLRQKVYDIEQRATDLRQNKLTDMKLLQVEVAQICQRIGSAKIKDAQEKQMLESEMLTMITRLDELEAELKLYRQRKVDERDTRWKS